MHVNSVFFTKRLCWVPGRVTIRFYTTSKASDYTFDCLASLTLMAPYRPLTDQCRTLFTVILVSWIERTKKLVLYQPSWKVVSCKVDAKVASTGKNINSTGMTEHCNAIPFQLKHNFNMKIRSVVEMMI